MGTLREDLDTMADRIRRLEQQLRFGHTGNILTAETIGTGLSRSNAGVLSVSGSGLTDLKATRVRKNSTGSTYGPRNRLNLIEGSNVTLTVADDGTDDEIDVTIAASGGSSTPNKLARYHAGGSQLVSNSTTTIINYSVQDYDPASLVTTGSSWVYTVPVDGIYLMEATIQWGTVSLTGGGFFIQAWKNSAAITEVDLTPGVNTTNSVWTSQISVIIEASASDTLFVKGRHSVAATSTIAGNSYINIDLLKET